MRGGSIAVVALVAAVLGGVVSLVAAKATGLADENTTTVYVPTFGGAQAVPGNEPVATARPLVGNGFDPSRIYAARSRGVVTVFAQYSEA
jgi:hypothetical protein